MLKVRIIFAVPGFKIYKYINLFAKDSKEWKEKVKSYLLMKAFCDFSFSMANLSNGLLMSGFTQWAKCPFGFLCRPNSPFTMTVYNYKEVFKSHCSGLSGFKGQSI